jgi:hypothetical protein
MKAYMSITADAPAIFYNYSFRVGTYVPSHSESELRGLYDGTSKPQGSFNRDRKFPVELARVGKGTEAYSVRCTQRYSIRRVH